MIPPRIVQVALLAAAVVACEGPHLGFPFDFERMLDQPRYDAYGESRFFDDGMAMRVPPPGTAPYRAPAGAGPFGTTKDREPASASGPVTRALLEEGRTRFEIYCGACHGVDGYAATPVADSMSLRPPPSLHEPRLRALSVADIRRVVREGYGMMPSYASLLDPPRIHAVAEYVKVLQASQRNVLTDLPPSLQREARRSLGARSTRSGSASPAGEGAR